MIHGLNKYEIKYSENAHIVLNAGGRPGGRRLTPCGMKTMARSVWIVGVGIINDN